MGPCALRACLELRPGVKAGPHSYCAVLGTWGLAFPHRHVEPECVYRKASGASCAVPSSNSSLREALWICGAGHVSSFTRLGVGGAWGCVWG